MTHCDTLQHTATHCDTLQHRHSDVAQFAATPLLPPVHTQRQHCNTLQRRHSGQICCCNKLQQICCVATVATCVHTVTHCNTLQHTATHYNAQQHTATQVFRLSCNLLQHYYYYLCTHCNTLQHTATHCNTLLHTATHCNTLQHTATHCNTLQRTATHCNTLQHTATHCNTGIWISCTVCCNASAPTCHAFARHVTASAPVL